MLEQGSGRRPLCELNGSQASQTPAVHLHSGQDKAWRSTAHCTLRDLCAEDKRKVAKLIRQVVEAEQRVQQLTAHAEEEARTRQRELERMQARSQEAAKESADLRAKLSRALALLRTYQGRLRAAHASAAAAPPPNGLSSLAAGPAGKHAGVAPAAASTALAARGTAPRARAPLQAETDLDESLLDLVAEWVHSGGELLGARRDSSSLVEENDVMSLISEQDWDARL
ncbi:hypothetical protein WJX81_000158 [Elliptochloris bilobata]|uniref:Uncharacterized protein n=1 Tax=Elliptochloris bilobata TaxID=381761 RepID=A0AAW1RN89_9CHLO